MSIKPKYWLQLLRKGKRHMLPCGLWQYLQVFVYPVLGGFLAARDTKSGFTGVINGFYSVAIKALKDLISQELCATSQHFDDIDNNVWSNEMGKC